MNANGSSTERPHCTLGAVTSAVGAGATPVASRPSPSGSDQCLTSRRRGRTARSRPVMTTRSWPTSTAAPLLVRRASSRTGACARATVGHGVRSGNAHMASPGSGGARRRVNDAVRLRAASLDHVQRLRGTRLRPSDKSRVAGAVGLARRTGSAVPVPGLRPTASFLRRPPCGVVQPRWPYAPGQSGFALSTSPPITAQRRMARDAQAGQWARSQGPERL